MKITKSQLKQIIKEELESVLIERKGVKGLIALIRTNAIVWADAAGLTEEDIVSRPGDAWRDIISQVVVHWGDVGSNIFGCDHDPDTPPCQTINSVKTKLQKIDTKISDIETISNRWVNRNWRMIKKTFDFVPPTNKPLDIQKTKAWRRFNKTVDSPTDL